MRINNLSLHDFRNFSEIKIQFEPGINLIKGKNGSGKTNIIEAINYLMFAKSFRGSEDKDLIRFNEEFAKIEIEVIKKEKENLKAIIYKSGKALSFNEIDLKKISELAGKLITVVFIPEDVLFFKDIPGVRRKFLDMSISGMNYSYLRNITRYRNLLKERNLILKEEEVDLIHLNVITEQMIEPEYLIMKERKNLVKELNNLISDKYHLIDQDDTKLEIRYISQIEEDDYETFKAKILERYQEEIELDMRRKVTSTGIHHDDLQMFRNGLIIQDFGSQGQNRLSVLSLKLALVDLIKEKTSEEPILILDDVLSELDYNHQKKLIDAIKNKDQVFITCADEKFQIENSATYVVENNLVTRR